MTAEYWEPERPAPEKRSYGLLIVLLVILGGLIGYFWYSNSVKTYVSKEWKFKVSFFAEPLTNDETAQDSYFGTTTCHYFDEDTTSYYCHVMIMDVPEGSIEQYGASGLYDITQSHLLRPNYLLTASSDITIDGYPGREIRIVTPQDGTAICRMVAVGNRVYHCLIANKDASLLDDPKVKGFLDSFHVLK